MNLERGTQIVYIPMHADGPSHPDCEFGFVTSIKTKVASLFGTEPAMVYCRYWRKGKLGELRTTCNSELTHIGRIQEYVSVEQSVVDVWLEGME